MDILGKSLEGAHRLHRNQVAKRFAGGVSETLAQGKRLKALGAVLLSEDAPAQQREDAFVESVGVLFDVVRDLELLSLVSLPLFGSLGGLVVHAAVSHSEKPRELVIAAARFTARETPQLGERLGRIAVDLGEWLGTAGERTTALAEGVTDATAKLSEHFRPALDLLGELGAGAVERLGQAKSRLAPGGDAAARLRHGTAQLADRARRTGGQLREAGATFFGKAIQFKRGRKEAAHSVPELTQQLAQAPDLGLALHRSFGDLVAPWNRADPDAPDPIAVLTEGIRGLLSADVYGAGGHFGRLVAFVEEELQLAAPPSHRVEWPGADGLDLCVGPYVLEALVEAAPEDTRVTALLAAAARAVDPYMRAIANANGH